MRPGYSEDELETEIKVLRPMRCHFTSMNSGSFSILGWWRKRVNRAKKKGVEGKKVLSWIGKGNVEKSWRSD